VDKWWFRNRAKASTIGTLWYKLRIAQLGLQILNWPYSPSTSHSFLSNNDQHNGFDSLGITMTIIDRYSSRYTMPCQILPSCNTMVLTELYSSLQQDVSRSASFRCINTLSSCTIDATNGAWRTYEEVARAWRTSAISRCRRLVPLRVWSSCSAVIYNVAHLHLWYLVQIDPLHATSTYWPSVTFTSLGSSFCQSLPQTSTHQDKSVWAKPILSWLSQPTARQRSLVGNVPYLAIQELVSTSTWHILVVQASLSLSLGYVDQR